MKIYTGSAESYWNCGDESGNDTVLIGIFDSPEQAYNAAMEWIHNNFKYDPDTNTYYGDFADEIWEEVWEYELNKTEPLGRMRKDDCGNWFNETKKMESDMNGQHYSKGVG